MIHKFLKQLYSHLVRSVFGRTSAYYAERKDFHYYKEVLRLAKKHAPKAKTVIDVGCADVPMVNKLNWIPNKTTINLHKKASFRRSENLQGDFMAFDPNRKFDLVLCLQVLEHLNDPAPFMQKLLKTGKIVIVSVPYKWKKGACKYHVQDPVDETKILAWSNAIPWIDQTIVKDDAVRFIAVFIAN